MTSIHFVDDVRRLGAYGVWSAIALPDGSQCSALRLPVREDQEDIIENVVAATQAVSRANLAGVAPVADVMLGGDEAWLLVAIPPSISLAELRVSHRLNAGEIALIALDIGHTLDSLHVEGLAAGAVDDRTVIVSRFGNAVLTEVGLAFALGDAESLGDPEDWTDLFGRGPGDSAGVRRPLLVTPPPRPDRYAVVRADTHAWAGLIESLAAGLRTGGELHGTPLRAVAERARRDGLGPALAMLGVAARIFPGYPSRANLSHMVRQRTGRGHTSVDLMEAIDRLLGGAADDLAAPVSAPVGGLPSRSRPVPPRGAPPRGVPARVGPGAAGPVSPRPPVPAGRGSVPQVPAEAATAARGAEVASAPGDKVVAGAATVGVAEDQHLGTARDLGRPTDISDSSGSPQVVVAPLAGAPTTAGDATATDGAITADSGVDDTTATVDAIVVAETVDDTTATADAIVVAGGVEDVTAVVDSTAVSTADSAVDDTTTAADSVALTGAPTDDAVADATATAEPTDSTPTAPTKSTRKRASREAAASPDIPPADQATTPTGATPPPTKPAEPGPAKPARTKSTRRRKAAAPAVTPDVDLFGNVEGGPVAIPGPARTPTGPKAPRTPLPPSGPASVRIGAGVPTDRTTRPRRLGRRRNTRLLAVNVGLVSVLVTALLGIQGWRADRTMKVTGVVVTVNQIPGTGCQLDADVTGTISTEGPAGKLTYQWQRNDGGTTTPVTMSIRDTGEPTVVHLRWTFTGMGEESVSIALKVLEPQEKQAVYSFVYRCM